MDPTNSNDVALKSLSDATSAAYEAAKAKEVSPTGEAKLTFPPWAAYVGAVLAAVSGAVLALPSAGVSVPTALTVAATIIGSTLGGVGIVSAGARAKP